MAKQNKKIAIIGSGALGTALAKVLYDGGNENIIIYGVDKTELAELKKGINTKYFPNSTKLPKFNTTDNINEAVKDASYVLIAVPSKVMDLVFADVLGSLNTEVLIINGSKGFYPNTMLSLHEGLIEASEKNKHVRGIVSLIGPSHAEEIVKEIPTIVATVDKDKRLCQEVQDLFNNEYFKTYIQTDVRGAEAGAAYKNVLAIASGIACGLGYGINTTAALLTRGFAEMQRYNKAVKGKEKTITGLTGLGDLIVTATSELSRNYMFGKQLATDGKKALETKATVEGLTALDVIYKIGQQKGLNLPIVNMLHEVVSGKVKAKDITKAL